MNKLNPLEWLRRSSWLQLLLIVAVVWGLALWAGARRDGDQGQVLRERARDGDIQMLSSQTCIFCARARSWLDEQRVPYAECFIETNAACLQEYQARGARGTPTFVVRNQTVLGFDRERIAAILAPDSGPGR